LEKWPRGYPPRGHFLLFKGIDEMLQDPNVASRASWIWIGEKKAGTGEAGLGFLEF
jgi:hypothetical protein